MKDLYEALKHQDKFREVKNELGNTELRNKKNSRVCFADRYTEQFDSVQGTIMIFISSNNLF